MPDYRIKAARQALAAAHPAVPINTLPTIDRGLSLFLAEDGSLMARVPAIPGHAASTFKVPDDAKGMLILMRVLHARQASNDAPTVGTEGSPNISMIEQWLRGGNKITKLAPKSRAIHYDVSLADIGL